MAASVWNDQWGLWNDLLALSDRMVVDLTVGLASGDDGAMIKGVGTNAH